jgi:hypothetical protein
MYNVMSWADNYKVAFSCFLCWLSLNNPTGKYFVVNHSLSAFNALSIDITLMDDINLLPLTQFEALYRDYRLRRQLNSQQANLQVHHINISFMTDPTHDKTQISTPVPDTPSSWASKRVLIPDTLLETFPSPPADSYEQFDFALPAIQTRVIGGEESRADTPRYDNLDVCKSCAAKKDVHRIEESDADVNTWHQDAQNDVMASEDEDIVATNNDKADTEEDLVSDHIECTANKTNTVTPRHAQFPQERQIVFRNQPRILECTLTLHRTIQEMSMKMQRASDRAQSQSTSDSAQSNSIVIPMPIKLFTNTGPTQLLSLPLVNGGRIQRKPPSVALWASVPTCPSKSRKNSHVLCVEK